MALKRRSESHIGVLGGTFDPVHVAHLELARLFAARLALSELLVVPSGQSWQKETASASADQRLAMLTLAFANFTVPDCKITIDRREIDRIGPSYTTDTLDELRGAGGIDMAITLLIGADQLLRLSTWHRWHDLFAFANLAVAGRPGFALDEANLPPEVLAEINPRIVSPERIHYAPHGHVAILEADLGPTSSSLVRHALSDDDADALSGLVPPSVLDYIRANSLYS